MKDVDILLAKAKETRPKQRISPKNSREFVRSEPHVHALTALVNGVQFSRQFGKRGFFNNDPKFTVVWNSLNRDRMESVVRRAGIKGQPHSSIYSSFSRSLFKTHCEPRVLQTHDRDSVWMGERNKFSAVPRQTSVDWTDCRRIRQERRQTSM